MENDFYVIAINSLVPDAKFHATSGGEKAEDNAIDDCITALIVPTLLVNGHQNNISFFIDFLM